MFKVYLIAMLGFTIATFSQQVEVKPKEPIETDRPDQTETPALVPAQMFQMETGFLYEQTTEQLKSFLTPTILFKYGVNDRFELRLITEIQTNQDESEKWSGLNPVLIGLKTHLIDEKGIVPKTSLIAHIQLPDVASDDFKAEHLATEFRFTMEHSLSDKISLGYNVGAEWDGDSPDAQYIYTLTTGIEITKKLKVFAEVYGFAPEDDKAYHNADAGGIFFISDNFAIDASGGIGLTDNAPDYFLSAGFSFRL